MTLKKKRGKHIINYRFSRMPTIENQIVVMEIIPIWCFAVFLQGRNNSIMSFLSRNIHQLARVYSHSINITIGSHLQMCG